MIETGADVYIGDDEGANIMHHVAIANQAVLAKTLLERYGHTICIANGNGDTPLGLAIQNNSLDVLAVLIPFLKKFPVSGPFLLCRTEGAKRLGLCCPQAMSGTLHFGPVTPCQLVNRPGLHRIEYSTLTRCASRLKK